MTKTDSKAVKKRAKTSQKLFPDAVISEGQWDILGQACMVSNPQVRLRQWPTRYGDMPNPEDMNEKIELMSKRLDHLLTCLYAQGKQKLLVIFQGLDTSGKDGVSRSIMHGVHPMSLRMVSFKDPSPQELAHDFLWRVHAYVPGDGESVIFNRSYYDALINPIARNTINEEWFEKQINHVNAFESLLVDSGTTILKIFLNISREEQEKRMVERWESPYKRWKLTPEDIHVTEFYSLYANAYERIMEKTYSKHAPWWIIPGDHKGFRNMITAEILVGTLERMGLSWPEVDPEVVKSEFWKNSKYRSNKS